MRDKEIKEQLSHRYEQDLENQRLRYENERQQRLRREMDANYRVQQDIKEIQKKMKKMKMWNMLLLKAQKKLKKKISRKNPDL